MTVLNLQSIKNKGEILFLNVTARPSVPCPCKLLLLWYTKHSVLSLSSTLFPIHCPEKGISSWLPSPIPSSSMWYNGGFSTPWMSHKQWPCFLSSLILVVCSSSDPQIPLPQLHLKYHYPRLPRPNHTYFVTAPTIYSLKMLHWAVAFSFIAKASSLSSVTPEVFSFFYLNRHRLLFIFSTNHISFYSPFYPSLGSKI